MKMFTETSSVFLDATADEEKSFSKQKLPFDQSGKSLVFLYLSTKVSDIFTYLRLLDTDHALVLLDEKLSPDLKRNLELNYQPQYIYDNTRQDIVQYRNIGQSFFSQGTPSRVDIHHDIKVLLSTSGTTGSPKLVKLSENNLISNAESILDYLPVRQDDVTPLNLPVYYSYGLSVLHTNLVAGARIICSVADVLQPDFWKQFERHGFTNFAGVPYLYQMLDRIGFRKKLYPSLRYYTQAGGNLNIEIKKLFARYAEENKVLFYVMYGQTEATARMSYLHPESLDEKIGSIGKPIKNGTFSIDTQGELMYEGPNVFGGYAECIEDLSSYDHGRVLHTGDLARVDDDGYYYITGRRKRFLKLFGSRVNLDEVENILKNNFNGIPFACTGDDNRLIVAVSADFTKTEITQFLRNTLGIHPSAIRIFRLDNFPLTSNGKANYSKIKELYEIS